MASTFTSTSSTSSTSSSSKSLSIEIITIILSKLPVKPLLNFKLVSKKWHTLISSPSFSKLHLSTTLLHPNNHLLLSYSSLSSAPLTTHHLSFSPLPHPLTPFSKPTTPKTTTLFTQEPPPGIQLLGSNHGIVCLCDSSRTHVFLFNPCTSSQRRIILPPPPAWYSIFAEQDGDLRGSCPSGDSYVYGFAYDDVADDYKLLRMVQLCGPGREVYNEAKVYSVKGDEWREVEHMPYFLMYRDHHHGVLVNEGLHYVVSDVAYAMDRKCIARFDVKSERFSLVERPEKYEDELGSWTLYLGELRGWLSFTVNYDFKGYADIWVMLEYGRRESWVKLLRVKKPGSGGLDIIQIRPITCSSDRCKVLIEVDNNAFMWYDMKSRKFQDVRMSGRPDEDFNTGVFMESLVSVSLDCDKVEQSEEEIVVQKPARKSKKKSPVSVGGEKAQQPARKPKKGNPVSAGGDKVQQAEWGPVVQKPARKAKEENPVPVVGDKVQPEAATRKPKNDVDNFLKVGFKLKL